DRALADRAVAALQRAADGPASKARLLLDAYRHDNARVLLTPAFVGDLHYDPYFLSSGLAFLSEHGLAAPSDLLDLAAHLAEKRPIHWLARCLAIAQALGSGDDAPPTMPVRRVYKPSPTRCGWKSRVWAWMSGWLITFTPLQKRAEGRWNTR